MIVFNIFLATAILHPDTLRIKYIESNTWASGDVDFSSHVRERYPVEHKRRNFISPRAHVLFSI